MEAGANPSLPMTRFFETQSIAPLTMKRSFGTESSAPLGMKQSFGAESTAPLFPEEESAESAASTNTRGCCIDNYQWMLFGTGFLVIVTWWMGAFMPLCLRPRFRSRSQRYAEEH